MSPLEHGRNNPSDDADAERKRAEEEIRIQSSLLDAVGSAIIAIDLDYKVVCWNQAAEEIYGWSADEVMGRSAQGLWISEDQQGQAAEIMAELWTGRSWSGEFVVQRKDGTTFPAIVTVTPINDEQGNLVGLVGASINVTERKRAEEGLRKSEERFRTLTQKSSDIITLLGADGTVRYQSPSSERILGYQPEELVGENVFDYVHPEDLGRVQGKFAEGLAEPDLHPSAQYKFRHKDGSWRYLESVGSNFLVDSKVGEFIVNSRDVTERVWAEEKVEQQAALLEHTHDAVFKWKLGGRIIYWNEGAQRLYGWSKEEVIGQISHDLLKTIYPFSLEELDRRLQTESHWEGELVHYARDGRRVIVESRQVLARNSRASGFVLETNKDITERKRAEERLQQAEARSRTLVERMPAVVYIQEIGSPDSAMYMSPQMETLTGYSPEECKDPDLRWRMVHPEDRERMQSEDERTGEPGEVFTSEYRVVHRDGRIVWVRNESVMFEEASRSRYWQGFMVDITERKRAEEALRESEQRFRQLFEQSVDAVFVHDEEGRFVDCNSRACLLLGYSREELLSLSVRDISCNVLTEKERAREEQEGGTLWQRAMAAEPGTFWVSHEEMNRRKDGTTFPVKVHLGSVDYGGRRMMLVSARDITEHKALEDELAYLAFHDSLTGLPNRALFLEHLEHALARAQRRDDSVAVLFLDLDNFKVVNDSLRHEVGDQLLVAVGQRLKGCLRSDAVAARMGGDEFTVLLEGISGVGDAEEVAERIIRELGAPLTIEGHLIFITASIGIALSDAAGEGSADLLRAADIALFRAKDKDKARYEVFDRSRDAHALERLDLENDLRKAIERDELRVHYQPVFSLVSDHIAGMEALLRWEHPERGIMSPAEFIPLAEETGLIVPVGQWVLEEACRQAREWQEQCPSDPLPIMGVNLSLRQFQHRGLADDVARILRETGLDPGSLALEITESVAMHDEDSTVATLEEIKSLGVWLVIDDFGTGHSSVSYLTNQFKMDHLKIDGSFIREFVEDPDNSAIISGLIDFAHAVGLRVIAEGVETADQLRRLKEMRCEFVQGTIIAEPLTPAAASELLSVFGNRTSTKMYD